MVSYNSAIENTSLNGAPNVLDWITSMTNGADEKNRLKIQKGFDLIQKALESSTRQDYFNHILSNVLVATELVQSLKLDTDSLLATLLSEFINFGVINLTQIQEQLGDEVANLVDGVSKMEFIKHLNRDSGTPKQDDQSEALRRMLLAMANDIRVVMITLAIRVAVMRAAKVESETVKTEMAKDTLDIYAPLANRLGIWQIKWELEDLSFRYLEPKIYKEIAQLLDERRLDREVYIKEFIQVLKAKLSNSAIDADVTGRPKHIFSIWKKMQRKDLGFNQIFDVRAVRVLVKNIEQCYAALGIVHSEWKYIRGEFDDYIAAPKDNFYRSLHTAVIGPEGKTVEVQIRTPEMHNHSELGVAAHWRYKEGGAQDKGFEEKITWLRQVLEWKDDVANADEFVDQLKDASFQDQVYVLTPKGEVIDLPKGSTPLDFAYHIHSEVGHRCRGAKVNGKIVPLTTQLKNSQVVEILTIKYGTPSRDWSNPNLGYLRSARARAKVNQWFRKENSETNTSDGRNLIEKELHRIGVSDVDFEKLAVDLNYQKVDTMFAAIGRGDLKTSQIINRVQETVKKKDDMLHVSKVSRAYRTDSDIYINGVGDLLTQIANCCHPVPGEPIVGYITRGRGVTIHRSDCTNILKYSTESSDR